MRIAVALRIRQEAAVASGGELARFILALKVQHLRISKPALAKPGKEKSVATSVAVLAEGERRKEIARML
jgi:DNA repair ATPase RecN